MADDPPAPQEPRRPLPPASPAELAGRLLEVVRSRAGALAAALVLVAGLGVAAWALLRQPDLPPTEELVPFAPGAGGAPGSSSASAEPPQVTTTSAPALVVHAAGAVAVPGLHTVPAGARVADLLTAAGGPSPDADLDRVNLAAPLVDGARVWFPRLGEAGEPDVVAGAGGGAGPGAAPSAASPVDLNAATAEQLDALPGVGPATATAIIEHRESHGPFRAVDDLLAVPGIGEAKLAQLRDLVAV